MKPTHKKIECEHPESIPQKGKKVTSRRTTLLLYANPGLSSVDNDFLPLDPILDPILLFYYSRVLRCSGRSKTKALRNGRARLLPNRSLVHSCGKAGASPYPKPQFVSTRSIMLWQLEVLHEV